MSGTYNTRYSYCIMRPFEEHFFLECEWHSCVIAETELTLPHCEEMTKSADNREDVLDSPSKCDEASTTEENENNVEYLNNRSYIQVQEMNNRSFIQVQAKVNQRNLFLNCFNQALDGTFVPRPYFTKQSLKSCQVLIPDVGSSSKPENYVPSHKMHHFTNRAHAEIALPVADCNFLCDCQIPIQETAVSTAIDTDENDADLSPDIVCHVPVTSSNVTVCPCNSAEHFFFSAIDTDENDADLSPDIDCHVPVTSSNVTVGPHYSAEHFPSDCLVVSSIQKTLAQVPVEIGDISEHSPPEYPILIPVQETSPWLDEAIPVGHLSRKVPIPDFELSSSSQSKSDSIRKFSNHSHVAIGLQTTEANLCHSSGVRWPVYNHSFACSWFLLATILSSSCVSGSGGNFTEIPVSQIVSIGETAVFQCRHSSAGVIRWKMNGSYIDVNNLPHGITQKSLAEGSDVLYLLKIVGQFEYDGVLIVAVAIFFDGSPQQESDPPALLQVATNVTGNVTRGFGQRLASQNVTVNTVAWFECQHSTASGINWNINGSALREFPEGIRPDFVDNKLVLAITALPEYNETVIRCTAFFDTDFPSEMSNSAVMTIQGKLGNVTRIQKTSSTLSWTPPFSLDLTGVDPDIVYCVEVHNITCGRRDLIISDCNVTKPSYTSDDIAPNGYIYEYTVTPRSNVEGARNGTPSKPLRDQLPMFATNSSVLSIMGAKHRHYQTKFTYEEKGLPIPSTYSLSLKSMDGLDNMNSIETITIKHNSSVTLDVVNGLPSSRLFDCTVLAYGCQRHPVLSGAELSTHDIQNISVSSLSGQVTVSGDFIRGSVATGVLLILVSDHHIYYHIIPKHNELHVESDLSGFPKGEHVISLFVLEKNGLPFERVATKPRNVSINDNSNDETVYVIDYEIKPMSSGVCITCTFLDNSTADCVVVIHQQISQLNSSGLMSIEASHMFTRSVDTAFGCIGVNMHTHQVGVIGGRQVDVKTQPDSKVSVDIIAGSIAASVLVLLCFVMVVLLIVVVYKEVLKRKNALISLDLISYRDGNDYVDTSPMKLEDHEGDGSEIPNAAVQETNLVDAVPEPTYAEVTVLMENTISAPPGFDAVKYDTVNGYLNEQGQKYAMLALSTPTPPSLPDDQHKTEYSHIDHSQHRQVGSATLKAENRPQKYHPRPTPFTVDNLITLLHIMMSEWKTLGGALSLDDDHLDEVDTNNETEDACLRDVLERYMLNSDYEHSWNEMSTILRKIGKEVIADKIHALHIKPYEVSLPGQTEQQQSNDTLAQSSSTTDIQILNKQKNCNTKGDASDEANSSGDRMALGQFENDKVSDSAYKSDVAEHHDNSSHSINSVEQYRGAVQPESSDNPDDQVLVHNSSDEPTIWSKDRTGSRKIEHINDAHVHVHDHCCEMRESVLVPGIKHSVPKREETTVTRQKLLIELHHGICNLPTAVKSFPEICDVSHTMDQHLDLQPIEHEQLDYFSQLVPTLTLPDHLLAVLTKAIPKRVNNDFMVLPQQFDEQNEDVTKYEKNDANEEVLGKPLQLSTLSNSSMALYSHFPRMFADGDRLLCRHKQDHPTIIQSDQTAPNACSSESEITVNSTSSIMETFHEMTVQTSSEKQLFNGYDFEESGMQRTVSQLKLMTSLSVSVCKLTSNSSFKKLLTTSSCIDIRSGSNIYPAESVAREIKWCVCFEGKGEMCLLMNNVCNAVAGMFFAATQCILCCVKKLLC